MKTSSSQQYDVTILGGGLAGLTCALHCRKVNPEATVAVLEKREHPVPTATHKIGESSVEVGANYFREFLGLEDHLENDQIPKMGLRLFLGAGDNKSIENRLELGGTDFPPTPSYQFDRGIFENYLAERCREQGVTFLDGSTIKNVDITKGKKPHTIAFERGGETSEISAGWVVDATGRAAMLKRKFDLKKECPHTGNSAWIRIGTRIKVDDWCKDPDWSEGYTEDHPRWQSTNHLLGEGYWIWMIPLASGSTSIGIVADEKFHELSDFNTQEKWLAWLEKHEPQLAENLRREESKIQDFCAIKRYPLESQQMYSKDNWGIVGDAGAFIDPFYSPGNDFIAISNYFINEMIGRSLAGKSNAILAPFYNKIFGLFFHGTGLIFRDNYQLFGNHQIMPIKILWDWMVYWTISGHIVIQGRVTNPLMYLKHMMDLKKLNGMNDAMQAHFRRWHKEKPSFETGGLINTSNLCLLMDTNAKLEDKLNDAEFSQRFKDNVAQMETLFWEIVDFSPIEFEGPIKRRNHSDTVKDGFRIVMETAAGMMPEKKMESDTPAMEKEPVAV